MEQQQFPILLKDNDRKSINQHLIPREHATSNPLIEGLTSSSMAASLSTPPGTTTSLFDLPPELFQLITRGLSPQEIASLRLTCRSGSLYVPTSAITAAHRKWAYNYLKGEHTCYSVREIKYYTHVNWVRQFPVDTRTHWSSDSISNIHANYIMRAEHLICYSCLVMLPWQCFTRKQRMGTRSFGHKDARKRFCIQCAARKGKWKPGTEVLDELGRLVLCAMCKQVKRVETGSSRSGCCSECRKKGAAQVKKETSAPAKTEPVPALILFPGINPLDNPISRSGRCQRCWAINHTAIPCTSTEAGPPLCRNCLNLNRLTSGIGS